MSAPLVMFSVFAAVVLVISAIAIIKSGYEAQCKYRIVCRNGDYYPQHKVEGSDKKFEWQDFHKKTQFSLGEVAIEYVWFDTHSEAISFIEKEKGIKPKPDEKVVGYY